MRGSLTFIIIVEDEFSRGFTHACLENSTRHTSAIDICAVPTLQATPMMITSSASSPAILKYLLRLYASIPAASLFTLMVSNSFRIYRLFKLCCEIGLYQPKHLFKRIHYSGTKSTGKIGIYTENLLFLISIGYLETRFILCPLQRRIRS